MGLLVFSFLYHVTVFKYILESISCLGIRMHACLLKAKKILEVGVQGSKLSIYTYLTYHSLHGNRKTTEKLFTQQGKN